MIKYRTELSNLFQEYNLLKQGAEIGVGKGEHAQLILSRYSGRLHLIDIWEKQNSEEYEDIANEQDHEKNLKICLENLKKFQNRFFFHKKKSTEACQDFLNESLDFVYIDANHKYEFVKKDIELWFPKIRKGGILSGHDYFHDWDDINTYAFNNIDKYIFDENSNKLGCFGVNVAVDEFCKNNNYELQLTRYEYFASWYIIK